ncbi:hypothetical protein H4R33_006127 [Dimargaris cristalligena]|uniref:Uncharacterized protein n=1 Tax=Dimargaris cristalligena TaxID=215637 RepID=A0A4Q0A1S2_9FUNG|nr:hypothetical protein H4R33_006127 [Dimargaris cristalligena]RKP40004.1 hypothetical protein BJ085DRAFT_31015 [Dimargaris cristalligena]|eukprot:RKP40004.1 hypothetical protein BJ085DRAFT_31015 [Dimargaris cristalligena]
MSTPIPLLRQLRWSALHQRLVAPPMPAFRRGFRTTHRVTAAEPPAAFEAEIYKPWYLRKFTAPVYQIYIRHFIILTLLSSLAINTIWKRMAFDEYLESAADEKATLLSKIAALQRRIDGVAEETADASTSPKSQTAPLTNASYFI